MIMHEKKYIAILDFGGQYAHLISKRLRYLGFYTQIFSPSVAINDISSAAGIILSGSPFSVYGPDRPEFNEHILQCEKPILGLCYGHQLIGILSGGEIEAGSTKEYGISYLNIVNQSPILTGIPRNNQVWMSHGDKISVIPRDYQVIAATTDCAVAAMENKGKKIFGLQFHPEVIDTINGNRILRNFVNICQMNKNWNMNIYLKNLVPRIKKQVSEKNVLLFLSGGVDSSVAFSLLNKALGKERVLGLYIDSGFMRKNESKQIMHVYKKARMKNVRMVNEENRFLKAVKGIMDPQKKRKIIGETFIHCKDAFIHSLKLDSDNWILAQGTLYPDIIESGGSLHADVIKTHHNRVQGIQYLLEKGLVVEPLKDLYKDEVRRLGKMLKLPVSIIKRHPFPGPGLAINVICSDKASGKFMENEGINHADNLEKIRQLVTQYSCDWSLKFNAILKKLSFLYLPVKSVGVQGDQRTYNPPLAIWFDVDNRFKKRDIEKKIFMDFLENFSTFLTNNIPGLNRVVWLLNPQNAGNLKKQELTLSKLNLDVLREIDAIITNKFKHYGIYFKIFQNLTILLPLGKENNRYSAVIRPVVSEDVMTARFAKINPRLLMKISREIIKKLPVDAVFYDISNKPPATFGWE